MKKFKQILAALAVGLIFVSPAFAQDTTMTIIDNKIGIGTTSPRFPVHIAGPRGEIYFRPDINIFRRTVLLGELRGAGFGAQQRFSGASGRGFIDIGQDSTGAFVVEGNDNIRLTVENSGNVGIGTTEPIRRFMVSLDGVEREMSGLDPNLAALFTSAGFTGVGIMAGENENAYIHFGDSELGVGGGIVYDNSKDALWFATQTRPRMYFDAAGNIGVGMTSPQFPLEMASGAHVTAGGVWTNASSRTLKENISFVDANAALSALRELQPVQYNYKSETDEKYLGFIAEDVPELVATKDRKSLSPMDVVALLTKVVQEQQKQIDALNARMAGNR